MKEKERKNCRFLCVFFCVKAVEKIGRILQFFFSSCNSFSWMNSCRIYFFYRAISTISSLIPFLDNQILQKISKIKFWNFWKKNQNSYPRPAPIKNETKLVIKTVKKTFLLVMKFLFLLSFEGNAESFELFELLILLEDEDFLLRIVANVHSLKNRKTL